MGAAALMVSGLIISCTVKNPESDVSENRLSESGNKHSVDLSKEKTALKNQALVLISDFNSKANDIKVDAYKNSKSLDEAVKKMLIEIEEQVIMLEDRLKELNTQSVETWPGFSRILNQELDIIRKNIETLSGKKTG